MVRADPLEDQIDDIKTGRNGKIVTFYSYKGGTGRSMALANVAWLLALQGRRVLVMDWDLEAPGIHRFFHPFLGDPALAETDGVLEYLSGLASLAASQPKDTDWRKVPEAFFDEHANVLSYARQLTFPDFPQGGQLDFIPAGRQDRTYSERLSLFQFVTFYERLGGRRFMDASKKWLRGEYDYVLLDSRTGVSDTSGICTVQMPDILVVCFTLNEQNIRGAAGIAADVRAQRKADEDAGRFRIYPVPTRVEVSEHDRRLLALESVRRTFNTYLDGMTPAQKDEYWGQTHVVYIPYYSLEEIPAVFGNPPKEQISMLTSTERLAAYLTDGKTGGDVASLGEVRRKEHLARFLRKLDDPAATAKYLVGKHAGNTDALRRLILRFVATGSGTVPDSLRPISLEEVGAAELPVLSDFRDARLILQDDDVTPPVLRLAPDELIRTWEDLHDWIKQQREFLNWRAVMENSAKGWLENPSSTRWLLRDEALDEAIAWRDKMTADLSPVLFNFIRSCEQADPVRAAERLVGSFGEEAAEAFFLGFVRSGEARRFVPVDEVDGLGRPVLDRALQLGVVREIAGGPVEKITGSPGFQLTTEDLLYRWPRLKEWRARNAGYLAARDELARLADAWVAEGKNPRLLIRGERLTELIAAVRAHMGQLSPGLREFLKQSESGDIPRRGDEMLQSISPNLQASVERLLLLFVRVGTKEDAKAGSPLHSSDFNDEERWLIDSKLGPAGVLRYSDGWSLSDPRLVLDWAWLQDAIERNRPFLELRTEFEDRMRIWATTKTSGLLLDEKLLRQWDSTMAVRAADVTPALRGYIAESRAHWRRRRRMVKLGATVTALLIAMASGLYLWRIQRHEGVPTVIKRAFDKRESGDLDGAIAELSQGLASSTEPASTKQQMYSDRAFCYRLRIEQARQRGDLTREMDWARVIEDLTRALSPEPISRLRLRLLEDRAYAFTQARDLESAIADYNAALNVSHGDRGVEDARDKLVKFLSPDKPMKGDFFVMVKSEEYSAPRELPQPVQRIALIAAATSAGSRSSFNLRFWWNPIPATEFRYTSPGDTVAAQDVVKSLRSEGVAVNGPLLMPQGVDRARRFELWYRRPQ